MKKDLTDLYGPILEKIVQNSDPDLFAVTTSENVYQLAEKQNRPYFKFIMDDLMLPGSGIKGVENLEKLHQLAKEGKSALILSAHFTNFDVPALYVLLKRMGKKYEDIFEDIIFIAGRKLTEGRKDVKAMAEMFSRVVISAKSDIMTKEDIKLALAINKASQKAIAELQRSGHIFVLYPTGTRSRTMVPSTHKGIREIYNYMRKFDYILFCGIEGNILPPHDDRPMIMEYPRKDKVVYSFSEVKNTKEYISQLEAQINNQEDIAEEIDNKQWVIDNVMNEIYSLGTDPRRRIPSRYYKFNPYYIAIGNSWTDLTSRVGSSIGSSRSVQIGSKLVNGTKQAAGKINSKVRTAPRTFKNAIKSFISMSNGDKK